MAPKKRIKRVVSPPFFIHRERRSKLRADPHPPPSSPPSGPAPPPPSAPASSPPRAPPHQSTSSPPRVSSPPQERIIPFPSRPVTTGRKINFKFFEEEGFILGNLLKHQDWEFICSLDLPTYPNLVREFYGNARVTPTSFKTIVKGVNIVLSIERLGEILRAPSEGAIQVDRESGLKCIFNRSDVLPFEQFSARHLPVEYRILHHMIARILLPRIGGFDFLTLDDLAILYHLIRKEPFNFPALAFKLMHEAVLRSKPALPYGMFLTLVFEEFGVCLGGEPSKKLQHFDTYDSRSLQRMKFKKIEGRWVKLGEEGDELQASAPVPTPTDDAGMSAPEDVPESSVPPASSAPPAPAPAAVTSIRLDEDQIQDIAQRVVSQLSDLLPSLVAAAVRDALASQQQSDPPAPSPPAPSSD